MIYHDYPSFWFKAIDDDVEEKKQPIQFSSYKLLLISAVALSVLSLATWNIIQRKPWLAIKNIIGGICIEVALIKLWPNTIEFFKSPGKIKAPLIISQEKTSKKVEIQVELKSIIEDLEACYPIKAVESTRIQNKQIGGIIGQACADAIGLFTEFTTQEQAQEMIAGKHIELSADYPKEFKYGYNWNHIKRFVKNGWTDDTDQALSLIRALYLTMNEKTEESPPFDILFALELKKWIKYGIRSEAPFIGRSDPYCMGLGALVNAVISQPTFLKNPKQTAESIWAHSKETPLKNRPAANGAIMRTAPIGLIFYRSFEDVIFYTTEACKVTHTDPRCIASCVALTLAIALSIRGYDSETIMKVVEKKGLAILRQELEDVAKKELLSIEETADLEILYETIAQDFKTHLNGDWETLDLDEGYEDDLKVNKIGYTFKCMGAAFYALRLAAQKKKDNKTDIFRSIIEMIAAEGGDADTNGAVAGALLGAYLGFKDQIPTNWTNHLADRHVLKQAIQHVDKLSKKVNPR